MTTFSALNQYVRNALDDYLPLKPFLLELARGEQAGMSLVRILGSNPDVDLVREMVTPSGDLDIPATKQTTIDVASSDAKDDEGNVGAEKIIIVYLDDNYVLKTKEIIMNGQTQVEWTSADFFRFITAYVSQVGSEGDNAGLITISNSNQSESYGFIGAGSNSSQCAIYTVPAGYEAYLLNIDLDGGVYNDAVEWEILSEMNCNQVKQSGVFLCHMAFLTGASGISKDMILKIPEKTTFYVTAKALTTGNQPVKAHIDVALVETGVETFS